MLDHSGSTETGEPNTKAGRSVEVAAVLALAAARQQDRVGALIFTDHVEHVVPPAKGRRHALRVIRDLLAFRPEGRRTDLVGALRYTSRLLSHRSIVVVLSDFVAQGWEQPIRQLASRHEVVAITVDDPRDRELPASGWIDFADAESGAQALVNTGNPAIRTRWKALAQEALGRRERVFKSAGVDHIALETAGDYALILRRAFARRLHHRRGPR